MDIYSESILRLPDEDAGQPLPDFKPGPRMSRIDLLISGAGLAFCLWPVDAIPTEARWVAGYVLCMFFLFLSVFRVSGDLQYGWTGIFVAVAAATAVGGVPNWALTVQITAALAMVIIIVQMRKPAYRGLFWKQVNPGLLAWWEAQVKEMQR